MDFEKALILPQEDLRLTRQAWEYIFAPFPGANPVL